ncbi:hypothetical protein HCA58_04385 [Micromonospora sp. HNM0581]|uniref:hypothetical protein n=1 Tax=Micromonospora sp. HNM0581 TaxID=2716341 RepID=UPI00146B03EC|nr:hypothetical protein [Micromonospora sp. HNM0581]NLU77645.1 hypothetical protein [Micromonospora sp. HNM0581]
MASSLTGAVVAGGSSAGAGDPEGVDEPVGVTEAVGVAEIETPGDTLGRAVGTGSALPPVTVGRVIGSPGVHAAGRSGPRNDSSAATINTVSTATPTSTTTQGAEAMTRDR